LNFAYLADLFQNKSDKLFAFGNSGILLEEKAFVVVTYRSCPPFLLVHCSCTQRFFRPT